MASFDQIFDDLVQDLNKMSSQLKLNLLPEERFIDEDEVNRVRFERIHDNSVLQSHTISIQEIIKIEDDEHFFLKQTPDVILCTNSDFKLAFFCRLRHLKRPINVLDLERLTILSYKLQVIHQYERLWNQYARSCTGSFSSVDAFHRNIKLLADNTKDTNVISHCSPFPVWPTQMTRFLRTTHTSSSMDNHVHMEEFYKTLIETRQRELKQQAFEYREEYESIMQRMENIDEHLTDEINTYINTYIFNAIRCYFEARIAMVEYIYYDHFLQWKFFALHITDEQLAAHRRITKYVFDRERANAEYGLYRESIHFTKLPTCILHCEARVPDVVMLINDPTVRGNITSKYKQLIEQTRKDCCRLLESAANTVKTDCQKQLDTEMATFWAQQNRLPSIEKWTSLMLTIMDQRRSNIEKCMKTIYELKGNFFLHFPPVVTTRTTELY